MTEVRLIEQTCKTLSTVIHDSVIAQLILHQHLYDVNVDELYPNFTKSNQLRRLIEVEQRLEAFSLRKVETFELPKSSDIRWLKNGIAMVQRGGSEYTSAILGRTYDIKVLSVDSLISHSHRHRMNDNEHPEKIDELREVMNSTYDPKRNLLVYVAPLVVSISSNLLAS